MTARSLTTATRRDLAAMPAELQRGTLAALARKLAAEIDAGPPAREISAMSNELRRTMAELWKLCPVKLDSPVDQIAAKREARLTATDVGV